MASEATYWGLVGNNLENVIPAPRLETLPADLKRVSV